MSSVPVLVSHELCPYVQRAVIVLTEKGVSFERRDIDLANKPEWFRALSPTGKTPMLLANGEALFESAAIVEYLDEIALPRLHPASALRRARHRAWMQFGSDLLNAIGAFYSTGDEVSFEQRARDIRARFAWVEQALGTGVWFDGEFSLVDAMFGPVFRYFDVFDRIGNFGFFEGLPKTVAWRHALARRPSVMNAVDARYPTLLRQFLGKKNGALARRLQSVDAAA